MAPHQFNDCGFIQSELGLDRFKGSSVLPSHFNKPGDAALREYHRGGLGLARPPRWHQALRVMGIFGLQGHHGRYKGRDCGAVRKR